MIGVNAPPGLMKTNRISTNQIGHWAWSVATGAALALVLAATLMPMGTHVVNEDGYRPGGLLRWGVSSELDILHNVLLFAPLGFFLAGILRSRGRSSRVEVTALVCVSCCAVSYGIELLQQFVPGRFPSLTDVIANGAGAVVGAAMLFVYETRSLSAASLAYIAVALLLSVPLQRATQLQNWGRQHSLLIGNEATSDRPWKGSVLELAIWDRARSAPEVRTLFTDATAMQADAPLSHFRFAGSGPYEDTRSGGPRLAWSCQKPDAGSSPGVALNGECYLESTQPPGVLIDRLKATSQFTLATTVRTANSDQRGPARIISLSHDANSRNLTLAQQRSDLVIRLRTPVTGDNGSAPEIVVPDVFATDTWKKLAVTYDGATLRVYVNGAPEGPILDLGPGAALYSYLAPLEQGGVRIYNALYYALVFIPWGIFGLLTPLANSVLQGQIRAVFVLLLPCVLLELLMAGASARGTRWENLFLSMSCAAAPVSAMALIRLGSVKRFAGW